MPFEPIQKEFVATLDNPSVGKVDMFLLNVDGPVTIGALSVRHGDKETANKIILGYNHHDEIVAQLIDYHRACDALMATLITLTMPPAEPFIPSRSSVWPTIQNGSALMKRLGVQL